MKRFSAVFVLAISLFAGCSEREPAAAIKPVQVGDTAAAMPVPKFDATLVSDQAAFKAQPAPANGGDVKSLVDSLPKGAAAANKPAEVEGDGDKKANADGDEDEDAEEDEDADAADMAGGTGSDVSAGTSSDTKKDEDADMEGEGEEKAEGEEAGEGEQAAEGGEKADVASMLTDAARPEVKEVPANPDNRPSQGIEMARKAAVVAASKALVAKATMLPMKEGTLGAAIIKDAGKGAASMENLNPTGIRVVAMKWKDADTLEVEVEISIKDLAATVAKVAPKLDLAPLHALGDDKCLAAKGSGIIPPNMRTANKAVPGERAKEAGEGGI